MSNEQAVKILKEEKSWESEVKTCAQWSGKKLNRNKRTGKGK